MSVGIWIASQTAAKGEPPSFAKAFFDWTGKRLQTLFFILWMTGLGLAGGAVLLTGITTAWVGIASLAWGVFGVVYAAATRRNPTWAMMVPAVPLLGIGLIV